MYQFECRGRQELGYLASFASTDSSRAPYEVSELLFTNDVVDHDPSKVGVGLDLAAASVRCIKATN
jgi:hypothetical protein